MAHRNARTYHWQRYRIEEQETQPLSAGNLPFRRYLEAHHLTIFDVKNVSGLRLSTLWNVQQNIPIRAEREQVVRAALRRMTGVAYTGTIVVHPVEHITTQGRRDHESF